jgi:hypothetical protein
MKFEWRDFDFNEILISESFKPFLNSKFGIWSKGSKFKSTALNQGHFLYPRQGFEFQKKI